MSLDSINLSLKKNIGSFKQRLKLITQIKKSCNVLITYLKKKKKCKYNIEVTESYQIKS